LYDVICSLRGVETVYSNSANARAAHVGRQGQLWGTCMHRLAEYLLLVPRWCASCVFSNILHATVATYASVRHRRPVAVPSSTFCVTHMVIDWCQCPPNKLPLRKAMARAGGCAVPRSLAFKTFRTRHRQVGAAHAALNGCGITIDMVQVSATSLLFAGHVPA
jgi:hypothetical protein